MTLVVNTADLTNLMPRDLHMERMGADNAAASVTIALRLCVARPSRAADARMRRSQGQAGAPEQMRRGRAQA